MSDASPPGWGQGGQPGPQGPPPGFPQGPPQQQSYPPQQPVYPPQDGAPPQGQQPDYGQAGYGQQPYGGGYSTPPGFGQPPKKNRTGLYIVLGLAVLVLPIIGVAVGFFLLSGGDTPVETVGSTPSAVPTDEATPTVPATPAPAVTDPGATDPGTAPPTVVPFETPTDATPGATSVPGVEQSVFELAVGTCFNNPGTADEIENVAEVPCETAHDNEVFALVDFAGADGDPFPGREPIAQFADEQCRGALFTDYVGSEYIESRYFVSQLTPTQGSWDQGDREIVCILFGNNEQLTGSVRGAGD